MTRFTLILSIGYSCLYFLMLINCIECFCTVSPLKSKDNINTKPLFLNNNRDLSYQKKEWRNPSSSNILLWVGKSIEYRDYEIKDDNDDNIPAKFSFKDQNLLDWVKFSIATGSVLVSLSYLWFLPIGPHLGDEFLKLTQSMVGSTDPAITIFAMLSIFAFFHSGLAGLRPYAEGIIGARTWRVIYACTSLPLALSCISYFVNHCHEGTQLWDITNTPGLHSILWITNFISFIFLYPSTFNLLEVAAIEKPQLHLWKPEGIIRITRHPQAVGQVLWCLAHTAYMGTTTALAASTMLVLHHGYSVWHGDRRLKQKHGDAFERVAQETSVIPFQAVWEGRQQLPSDYYNEFLRGPYLLVVLGTIAAYNAHPFMMGGAALLHW